MSVKRKSSSVNEPSDNDRGDKRPRSTSQSAVADPLPGISSFHWDHLTGKSDLIKECDFLALWRQLFWHQLKDADRAKITPRDLKLPLAALDWTNWIEVDDRKFVGGGGFGDAFKGRWCNLPADIGALPELVLKVVKVGPIGTKMADKRYKLIQREISIWNAVQHENIVPFVGICYARGPECPTLISPFMENRDVMFYLRENPHVNRQSMLLGIALGLEFLHNFKPKIIHGDVKGANILVNKSGQPCLIDFGISRMVSDQTLWRTSSTHAPGSIRWQAPELMSGIQATVTAEGDIYSFAMTCLEVLTGSAPFREYTSDVAVLTAVVVQEKTPLKPANIDIQGYVWIMLNRCWVRAADTRPSMTDIVWQMRIDDFMNGLLISSFRDVQIFTILYLLNAGDREAALNMILLEHRTTCSNELRSAWNKQPPSILIHLLLNHRQKPSYVHTSLLDAVESGAEDKVQLILDSIPHEALQGNVDNDLDLALIRASRQVHYNIIALLLQHPVGIKALKSALELNLFYEIKHDGWELIDILLPHSGKIFSDFKQCMELAVNALRNNHPKIVKMLIEHGVDILATKISGMTAFHYATKNGQIEVVKLLLEYGADIEAKGYANKSALHIAAENGHIEMVELLLKHGAKVVLKDDNDHTALHIAAKNGHIDMVELLLKHGAKAVLKDDNGETALGLAVFRRHIEIVKLLLEYSASILVRDTYYTNAFKWAAADGHIELLKQMLDQGADIALMESTDPDITALHLAAVSGQTEVVKLLLKHGADIEAKDGSNDSALCIAAGSGHIETVELLLKHGAKDVPKGKYDDTPLGIAADRGDIEIVKLLLEHGAKIATIDSEGYTALDWAVQKNYVEVVKLLLKHSAGILVRDTYYTDAFQWAAADGRIELMKQMLDQGADISLMESAEWTYTTALHLAAGSGHTEVVKLLLEHGADTAVMDSGGILALHRAADNGSIDIVKLLLEHGADITARGRDNRTALHWATRNDHVEVVKLLLELGAELESRDRKDRTALDWAVKKGSQEVVKLLLEHGAEDHSQRIRTMSS